jgi:DNA-binding FrmR family transcriptional regulator
MAEQVDGPAASTGIEQLQARLGRIEGQIRGIAKMLESGRACEDVVTQLMAVRSGIDTVGGLVLDVHLAQCIADGSHEQQLESLRDSLKLWWRFAPASGLSHVEGEASPWPRPD